LLLLPDLNAGNILYKSFVYIGGGECAGLVLGARVPVVLTSRADSPLARLASAALAVLATSGPGPEGAP
jgi:phosphate acetyltransferase/phosphate butyryltransferase